MKKSRNIVSIARVGVGTVLPAPLGATVMGVLTFVLDSKPLDIKVLLMIPLFALFGYTLIGVQSLIAALALEFGMLRPERSLQLTWLAGAGLGALSTVPLWKANSDYLTLSLIGLLVGAITAFAMHKAGQFVQARQQLKLAKP